MVESLRVVKRCKNGEPKFSFCVFYSYFLHFSSSAVCPGRKLFHFGPAAICSTEISVVQIVPLPDNGGKGRSRFHLVAGGNKGLFIKDLRGDKQ